MKKAIIPAAGLGTRFLPATKTVPKEMLTIVDAPIIFYVVEEAIQAGVEDIVLIQGRGKTAIEDFFDTSYELEDKLAKDGKFHLLERLTKIRDMANIISVRQKTPAGLGHAVLCGEKIIGNQPFAVLLGDEIMVPQGSNQNNTTALLTSHFENLEKSIVAVMKVADSEVSKYGIADLNPEPSGGPYRVKSFVEKPKSSETASRWALPGRYVFTPSIFNFLKNVKPGLNGEIQLTDAMNKLAHEDQFYASEFQSVRHDAGDKFGYLRANIELGLQHPDVKEDLKNYLIGLSQRLS